MLRELTHEEMGFVSGGDIIVNGIPLQSTVGSGVNDPLAPYMQTGYYGYLATQALVSAAGPVATAPSDGDSDGDGVTDGEPPIVVTANERVSLGGDYFGRYDGLSGLWMIWEDDLIWDDFMGWFRPGTPENHTVALRDSDWGVGAGGGVTPGPNGTVSGNTSGGSVSYWIAVPPPPR